MSSNKKILILHGCGMKMRGKTPNEIAKFGPETLESLDSKIGIWSDELSLQVTIIQSDWEGKLIEALFEAYEKDFAGVIINPAMFTTGYPAIAKALVSVADKMPAVEVHYGNIIAKGVTSDLASSVKSCIFGFGTFGYRLALQSFASS